MRERQLRKEADEGKEQNKTLIQRYFAAYDRGDIDGGLRFVDVSHVYHPPGSGESLGFVARRNEDAFFSREFSRIRTTIEDQVAEGDKVVSRVTMVADHTGEYQRIPPTPTRTKITFTDLARVESRKIVEQWTEFDMMSILQQLRQKNNAGSSEINS